MDDIQKMFQIIINGQSAFRQEILKKFDDVYKRFDQTDEKIDQARKELHERIDKIGLQLAYLEDDAPTREEFDHLKGRVDKTQSKTSSANL